MILKLISTRRIAVNALKISFAVGTILNLINQGSTIFSGSNITWHHLALNYFVPYCVATYSAVRNELDRSRNE